MNLCDICHFVLNEPYIACAECKYFAFSKLSRRLQICLKCFASGANTATHSNAHSYVIMHDHVKVFPKTQWSSRDDCFFLDLIERYGIENWSDISRIIGKYSNKECQNHYMKYYFDGIFWKTCQLTKFPYSRLVVPYLFRSNSFDPPRCKLDVMQSKFMSNYRFARSDFDTPFDCSAECVVADIHLDNEGNEEFEDISAMLNCALVVAYNNRLR